MCRNFISRLPFAFTLLFLGSALAQTNQPGVIRGIVLNEQGTPVMHANVWCHLVTTRALGSAVPSALTGNDGRFSITDLQMGEYIINPWKEDEGYPNRAFALYGGRLGKELLVRITLDTESPIADNLILVMGPKSGIVGGSIVDSVTGTPVTANVRISRTDGPAFREESSNGTYRLLVPPNTSVGFSVRAPGYRDWYYPNVADSSGAAPLLLNSGERKTINVRLVPQSK